MAAVRRTKKRFPVREALFHADAAEVRGNGPGVPRRVICGGTAGYCSPHDPLPNRERSGGGYHPPRDPRWRVLRAVTVRPHPPSKNAAVTVSCYPPA